MYRLGLYNSRTLQILYTSLASWYEGHEGEERVNCLTNCGARCALIGPELFWGVPLWYVKWQHRGWRESEFVINWAGRLDSDKRGCLYLSRGSCSELRTLTGYLSELRPQVLIIQDETILYGYVQVL